MLTIGVDLVEIKRIEAAIARFGDRFVERVFTEQEQSFCRGRVPELAARFAAKEAVSKALGVGIQNQEGVCWRDINVISDARGKPSVQLLDRAAERAGELGLSTFALSLSHTDDYAIAMLVAE